MFEELGFISVIPIEAKLSAEPDEAKMVLHYPGTSCLEKSRACREPSESDIESINRVNTAR